jgi:hypothetical protein
VPNKIIKEEPGEGEEIEEDVDRYRSEMSMQAFLKSDSIVG